MRTWPAGVVLAVWAFVSITGTRDMLETNGVSARMTRDLEAQGVPPSEIDAGHALNGWRLYAHPENLPPKADPHTDVPFVTAAGLPPYQIVTAPRAGFDVLRTENLPAAWWQVGDRLYLVHRHE